MSRLRARAVLVVAIVLVAARCGGRKSEPAPSAAAPAARPAARAATAVPAKPAPFVYPPPVKGHFADVNTGTFDLVDGIAYTAPGKAGTVVYATSKAIASPLLAGSPCPMTQARALTVLRAAGWAEVTLDARGKSRYFGSGMAFGGSSRQEGSGWSVRSGRVADGRATGSVVHEHGGFSFDLPVFTPGVDEVSEGERVHNNRLSASADKPAEAAVRAAYGAVREAVGRKDWTALLKALGFGEKQVEGIRGLAGIDGDLAAYADRFLDPGAISEFSTSAGAAYVGSEGTNSNDKKFVNFYHFVPCADRLVLVQISVNPQ